MPSPVRPLVVALTCACTLAGPAVAGCGGDKADDNKANPALADGTEGQPVRQTTGTIKDIKGDGSTLVIAHEEIKGFMKAMTMPFTLSDPALGKGLSVGDRVSLSFVMNRDGKMVIQTIEAAAK